MNFRDGLVTAATICGLLGSAPAFAGNVFLTGHDPDFHAQDSAGAADLLKAGLNYVTGGTYSGGTKKFLWVESFDAAIGGHRVGELALNSIGLTLGTNFDWVDAAGLSTVNFKNYSAIALASDFGGMLTKNEIDGLIARSSDLDSFINAGGGLFASSECAPGNPACDGSLVDASTKLYGYLPVVVSSVVPSAPFTVTAFGATLGLTDGDLNDPTHNSFGLTGGLNIVDRDSAGVPTTLAGSVTVGGGGFVPSPEPAGIALMLAGLAGLALARRRKA